MAGIDPDGCSVYVGNLDPRVCTELLEEIFGLVGRVKLSKVVGDKQTGLSLGFGFVDFHSREEALRALTRLNGRVVYGRELRVDWAHTGAGAAGRSTPGGDDTSSHYSLFIGNISPELDDTSLIEAFGKFGTSMSSAKISRDPETQRPAGFGFVTYREKQDAEAAIAGMNNTVLGMKALRVDWARSKGTGGRPGEPGMRGLDGGPHGRHDYDTIVNQTPPTNVTVYIAGLPAAIDEATLTQAMAPHGDIEEVKIPEAGKVNGMDRAYAFVKYRTHDEAAKAIVATHSTEIMGRVVSAQWGRESVRRTHMLPGMIPPGMPMAMMPGGYMAPGPQMYGPPMGGYHPGPHNPGHYGPPPG